MKKLIAVAVLAVSPMIASADGASGCGWGAALMEGNNGPAAHILAMTTNGSSGNNTFGVSSGTNGCSSGGTLSYSGNSVFAAANMDKLAHDMAQGEGETLDTLASMFNIANEDKTVFNKALQDNFVAIYPHSNVTGGEVIASLVDVMRGDEALAKYVS